MKINGVRELHHTLTAQCHGPFMTAYLSICFCKSPNNNVKIVQSHSKAAAAAIPHSFHHRSQSVFSHKSGSCHGWGEGRGGATSAKDLNPSFQINPAPFLSLDLLRLYNWHRSMETQRRVEGLCRGKLLTSILPSVCLSV